MHIFKQAVALDDAEPLLNGRTQLHASQAIKVEIFSEAQLVAHAGRGFTGDLRDEGEEPVGRRPKAPFPLAWCEPLPFAEDAARVRASHAATGLRLTLPVEVRGRSGSGQSTQRLMR